MDKLGQVREVLVQNSDKWEQWGLEEFVKILRKYMERNPLRGTKGTGRTDETPRNQP